MSCDPDEMKGADLGVGDALPTFSVKMNDGTSVATSDLKGRPSVIVFFATTVLIARKSFQRCSVYGIRLTVQQYLFFSSLAHRGRQKLSAIGSRRVSL